MANLPAGGIAANITPAAAGDSVVFDVTENCNIVVRATTAMAVSGESIAYTVTGPSAFSDSGNITATNNVENLGTSADGTMTRVSCATDLIALTGGSGTYTATVTRDTTDILEVVVQRGDSRSGLCAQAGHSLHSFPTAIQSTFGLIECYVGASGQRQMQLNRAGTIEVFDDRLAADVEVGIDRYHRMLACRQLANGDLYAIACDHNEVLYRRTATTFAGLASDVSVTVTPSSRTATYGHLETNPDGDEMWITTRDPVPSEGIRIWRDTTPSAGTFFDPNNGDRLYNNGDRVYLRGTKTDDRSGTGHLLAFCWQSRPNSTQRWRTGHAAIFDTQGVDTAANRGQWYDPAGVAMGANTTGNNESNLRWTSAQTLAVPGTAGGGAALITDPGASAQRFLPGDPAMRFGSTSPGSDLTLQTAGLFVDTASANPYDYASGDIRIFTVNGSTRVQSSASANPLGIAVPSTYRAVFATQWWDGDDLIIAVTDRGARRISLPYGTGDYPPYHDMGADDATAGGSVKAFKVSDILNAGDSAGIVSRTSQIGDWTFSDLGVNEEAEDLTVTSLRQVPGLPGTVQVDVGINEQDPTDRQGMYVYINVSSSSGGGSRSRSRSRSR